MIQLCYQRKIASKFTKHLINKEVVNLNRPYIICHMLQSINGSIDGKFFEDKNTIQLAQTYSKTSEEFETDGIIYGSTTADELFGFNESKKLHTNSLSFNKEEDFIIQNANQKWIVVFDPSGIVKWSESSLTNPRLKNKNIVVIVSKLVSTSYLSDLRNLKISYILGGKDNLDIEKVLNKLYMKCGIRKLLLQGGGILNGSFMNGNFIDEISLIISPNIHISNKNTTCFEDSSYLHNDELFKYVIADCKILNFSGIWLHYKKVK